MRRVVLLIAFLAGCDEDNPVRHLDGGVTIDAPMIDAPVVLPPVTLTITLDGEPQVGVVVHYQNPDSSLVATETTDANGKVSRVIAAGGYVTAIDPFRNAQGLATNFVRTFAGVKPGDNLVLSESSFGPTITMTVTLPVQPDTQTTRYSIDSPCSPYPREFNNSIGSGFQPTGLVTFVSTCTMTDIIAVKFDASNAIVGYFVVAGQTVTANGTLDYTAKAFMTPTNRTYTFNNKPASLTLPDVEEHIGIGNSELLDLATNSAGSPPVATIGVPTVPNGISVIETTAFSTIASTRHTFLDWGPTSTTAFTTDLGARKLVDVSAPEWDGATHTLSWTEGTGAAPEATYASLFVTHRTGNTIMFGVDWRMVAPHAAGTTKFPKLPVGAVDLNPDADDDVDIGRLLVAKVPGGYDAVRANGFVFEKVVDADDDLAIAMGAPGSAQFAEYMNVKVVQRPAPPPLPTALRNRVMR